MLTATLQRRLYRVATSAAAATLTATTLPAVSAGRQPRAMVAAAAGAAGLGLRSNNPLDVMQSRLLTTSAAVARSHHHTTTHTKPANEPGAKQRSAPGVAVVPGSAESGVPVFQSASLADITIPEVSLADFVGHIIKSRVASTPDRVILSNAFTGQDLTYKELHDNIEATAQGLSSPLVGVRDGDVIGMLLPNSFEFYYSLLGSASLGATTTLINPGYEPREVAFQLKDSGAKVLITSAALLDTVHAVINNAKEYGVELTHVVVVGDGHGHRHEQHHGKGNPTHAHVAPVVAQHRREHPHAKVQDPSASVEMVPFQKLMETGALANKPYPKPHVNVFRDVLVLPYSSGTTGLPKGVCLSNRNIVGNILQFSALEQHLDGKKDVFIGILPYYHIYGFMIALVALYRDIKLVVMPKFDLPTFLDSLGKHKVTVAHVAPPVVVALAKHPLVDKYKFPQLRQLFSGAAPLSHDMEMQVIQRLKVQVKQAYGMTETSPMAALTPDHLIKQGSVGPLGPNTKAKVFDHGTGKFVGVNQEGEILLKGPQVMLGYWQRPEATAATIDDEGYLHTGDIGRFDEDGYLYIVDRVKELIKVKGFQVAPAELEGILLSHPGVADAAVVPKDDERHGELPVAFVVKKQTHAHVADHELAKFVEGQVATHKRLQGGVRFVEAIPKSPSGKILRRILRDQLKAEASAASASTSKP
ncbi:phenylacetyl-CoA ligase [Capsaspora owczarzaki ATCC 30864]|uniref:Phenylacetyl-CoA ligase n=1 Tax=Capsaspora owczarzaki (strain ATCC 30864) TaxID=595528 RepID=A0A0D2U3L9_CAPO3|nr:phenylacetyl-CoA ligase [Capsaspora owczarzaki ATCC 30864]KJE89816.1 phenylacetyl-CoA ligase [Capsaspora owczarzaki ATCC 30864]|eukprot:XP_004349756.1 phenylacetyl-CoA ligase [Capsaspora owczarzaki ATCC 30864]